MLAEDMYGLRRTLEANDVIFCYSGLITEEVLSGIGVGLKRKLEKEDANKKTARALFSIFVEQVQNVIRYSAERDEGVPDPRADMGYGVLAVGNSKGRYFVSCANLVHRHDVERLNGWLTEITRMSRDEIKHAYKNKLKAEECDSTKGAGVGFLDIAWRASKGFDFGFLDIDRHPDSAYFCLKAYV